MSTATTLRATYPRTFWAFGQWRRPVGVLNSVGDHTLFYGKALAGIPFAVTRYRREIIRLIAEISMGAGTLAMIGGTVVIVGFLTLAAGGTLAVQGYSSLGNIGIEALTGFLAAFINVRIAVPVRRRCVRTWVHARFAKRSTRWRFWASTRCSGW